MRRLVGSRLGRLGDEFRAKSEEKQKSSQNGGWQATEGRRSDRGGQTTAKPDRGEPARALRDGEGGVVPAALPPGNGAEGVCPSLLTTRPHLAVALPPPRGWAPTVSATQ